MIVSNNKKFAYIHIYKTGGSTLTHYLTPYVEEENRMPNVKYKGVGWQPTWHLNGKQHAKLSYCLKMLDEKEISIDKYFLFVFVRNPYTWVLSVWNNFYRGRQQHHPNMSFTEFIFFIRDIVENNKKAVWGSSDQYSFITNKRGVKLDFIGKFEQLEKDIHYILEKLDIPTPDKLVHKTKTSGENRSNYLEFYNKDTLEVVNKLFYRDFEYFDYLKQES